MKKNRSQNKKLMMDIKPIDPEFIIGVKEEIVDLRESSHNMEHLYSKTKEVEFFFNNTPQKILIDEVTWEWLPNVESDPKVDGLVESFPTKEIHEEPVFWDDDEKKNYWTELISRLSLRPYLPFLGIALIFAAAVWSFNLAEKVLNFEKKISATSISAFSDLADASSDISAGKIWSGSEKFKSASDKFLEARKDINSIGGAALVMDYFLLPPMFESKRALLNAGEDLATAGQYILEGFSYAAGNMSTDSPEVIYGQVKPSFEQGEAYLDKAIAALDKVDINDVPEDKREKFVSAREKLPAARAVLDNLLKNDSVILKILGMDRPKKYLLLFQNNSEMRATGGFIGTYGILDIENGRPKDFFMESIYNPDGQLVEKIIPPMPVQRVSDAWSMHDANWFADFPTSAQKVALLYEKTGGETVDGVVAFTPQVMLKLLEITGPIEMTAYNRTVNAENFMEVTQYEVEVNYDKTLNEPKKFLIDLQKELEKRITDLGKDDLEKVMQLVSDLMKEKHVLVYFKDPDLEEFAQKNGWGGQLVAADSDFLSVVHSNLGGYKTDGVMEEKINHKTEIQEDGSVIDTVDITRSHLGGNSVYDWWNRVSVDYLRVYVPEGSELITAQGHTWEKPWRELHPYNYSRFHRDPDVAAIENTIIEDKKTGTQIFKESGKTVFGNWVFISPGETVTVTYKYKLPFKATTVSGADKFSRYSLYLQKQSGSVGGSFTGSLYLPNNIKSVWSYPEGLAVGAENNFEFNTTLAEDRIFGAILQGK